ncbi:hypothetical protein NONI108955_26075 [Nocardia ninae]|uniref:Uncharacterized protein n=1 Tax=Nocardia ninae NBRC 108245 TaxID=1210091 RepID=A0A511MQP1_9NOCA|nr:hypothetical protein [Nocardia ninae]GEM42517.1 hypothetical protein NN4_70360 [Nocardia ninae NBRC 108245]
MDPEKVGWSIPAGSTSRFDTTTSANGEVATVIEIPNAAAPQEYSFRLELPAGAVTELQPDGSVTVNNKQGRLVGGFKTPWAKDAGGAAV